LHHVWLHHFFGDKSSNIEEKQLINRCFTSKAIAITTSLAHSTALSHEEKETEVMCDVLS